MANLLKCAQQLQTELQKVQSALASVTLERDEAIARETAEKLRADFQSPDEMRQDIADLRAQLAACQSREAKALEELVNWKGRYKSLDGIRCNLHIRLSAIESNFESEQKHGFQVEKDARKLAGDLKQAEADRDQLQAQVGALRDALEWYADKTHWDDKTTATSGGDEECKIYLGTECMFFDNIPGWTRAVDALASAPAAPDSAKLSTLRSALMRVTGSLGLVIGGAIPSAQGHVENYKAGKTALDATASDSKGGQ